MPCDATQKILLQSQPQLGRSSHLWITKKMQSFGGLNRYEQIELGKTWSKGFFSLMLEPLLDIMFSNCRHFMKVGVENDHRLIPVWWRNESSHGDDKLYNVHPREEFAANTCKHPPWCTIFTPSSSFNMKNQVVLAGWKRFFNPMA